MRQWQWGNKTQKQISALFKGCFNRSPSTRFPLKSTTRSNFSTSYHCLNSVAILTTQALRFHIQFTGPMLPGLQRDFQCITVYQ